MKKLSLLSTFLSFLFVTVSVYAAESPFAPLTPVARITIAPPEGKGIDPLTNISQIFANIMTIVFIVAVILVLVMLIWGAFQWITSAGDKEKVGAARGRIINALIGLAILALAFLILKLVGSLININLFDLDLPPLGPAAGTFKVVP